MPYLCHVQHSVSLLDGQFSWASGFCLVCLNVAVFGYEALPQDPKQGTLGEEPPSGEEGVAVQTLSRWASLLHSKQSFLNLEEEALSATSTSNRTYSTAG